MNRVIDEYAAHIDGKRTALAGCESTTCKLECIRGDKEFKVRFDFKCTIHNDYKYFIEAK